jgi:hypothetical protein
MINHVLGLGTTTLPTQRSWYFLVRGPIPDWFWGTMTDLDIITITSLVGNLVTISSGEV